MNHSEKFYKEWRCLTKCSLINVIDEAVDAITEDEIDKIGDGIEQV